MSKELTVEVIAKMMADRIGHGMREKCDRHAEVAFELLANKERETADNPWIDTRDRLPMYGEPCLIVYHEQIQHITYCLPDEDGLWWPCDETTVELDEGMDCYDADKWLSLLGLDK